MIGSAASILAILYSVSTTKEIPLTKEEVAAIKLKPQAIRPVFAEIAEAFGEMLPTMKQLKPYIFCLLEQR